MRKKYSSEFKAKVAMPGLQEQKTLVELAGGEYGVHPTQTVKWKKELQERAKDIFGKDAFRNAKAAEMKEAEPYRQIGRLKAEVDWLKKNPLKSTDYKRGFIEPENKEISIRRKRVLLGIQRSGYYCKPAPESESNKALMEVIDRIYTSRPYYSISKSTRH
ncbi:MAG: transposase [Synergistaceae bacterium]|jgi:putative transposase|nr:transposase [Synergistaceae bacterium]